MVDIFIVIIIKICIPECCLFIMNIAVDGKQNNFL